MKVNEAHGINSKPPRGDTGNLIRQGQFEVH